MRDGSRPLLQNDLIGHRLTRLTRPPAGREKARAFKICDASRYSHGNKQYALSCVRSHNGTEHYGDTQQEHSNVKPFQAKLIRSQWVSAVGGIREAYRLSLIPWAPRPGARAPRVSSLITISDGLGPISHPLSPARNMPQSAANDVLSPMRNMDLHKRPPMVSSPLVWLPRPPRRMTSRPYVAGDARQPQPRGTPGRGGDGRQWGRIGRRSE